MGEPFALPPEDPPTNEADPRGGARGNSDPMFNDRTILWFQLPVRTVDSYWLPLVRTPSVFYTPRPPLYRTSNFTATTLSTSSLPILPSSIVQITQRTSPVNIVLQSGLVEKHPHKLKPFALPRV